MSRATTRGVHNSFLGSKIRLFEKDEGILDQIKQIDMCFLDPRSDAYEEMRGEMNTHPFWEDKSFRRELDALIAMAKKRYR